MSSHRKILKINLSVEFRMRMAISSFFKKIDIWVQGSTLLQYTLLEYSVGYYDIHG
jgi:hypothetical protein